MSWDRLCAFFKKIKFVDDMDRLHIIKVCKKIRKDNLEN
jgi:hypothetical protein